MDVRCERCRAEYVIADDEVGDEGLALRCAGCGHVFRVKRKAFVVTMPLKPGELADAAPVSTADLDRRRRESKALAQAGGGEGPVVAGELAPVAEDRWEAPGKGRSAGDEPAWASPGSSPSAPERPERLRERERSSVWPKLAFLAVVLAAGAAVVLLRPQWVGLAPVVVPLGERAPTAPGPTAAPPEQKPAEAAPAPPPASLGEGDGKGASPTATAGPPPNPNPTATPAATPDPAPVPAPPAIPAPNPTADDQPSSPPPGERAGRGGSAASSPPASAPTSASPPPPALPAKPPKRVAAPEKPSSPTALVGEARRLRDRGRSQEALDVYGRALAASPANAEALAGRGLCYLDLSQYRPAEASFEEALRAEPTHPEALMGLAETYRYEGRRADAVTYYERYLSAHPTGRDAAAARSAIDALKE